MANLARRPSARSKRETLPSTFPKELLKNPFGLPLPVELPPVPPLATAAAGSQSPVALASPSRIPPKSPLSPEKLAAIANALGVHAPSPASARSPSSSAPKSPATSRHLLHVIPPNHLAPAEDDDDDEGASLAPFPKAAPGYHTQFFRGTLIPLHPTLQSMLGAIAREYAMPSTGGMFLYLYHDGDPGPRITDDVWKLLWFKALKAERDDSVRTLKALSSTKSSPASSYPSPTSSEAHGSGSLDITLPSPVSLPIIAKVEFDIDRRKAPWYDNWVRTRHLRSSRPSTPASTHSTGTYEYPRPLALQKRSRASSFTSGRDRTGTGSSSGKFSMSASDKAAADDEVDRVTRRVGLGYSTPRRKRPGQVPPPLKVLSDSPTEFEDEEDSHLAYRILIDGPADGDDDDYLGGGGNRDPRASHIIMKEQLDTLEKAMMQYSPRFEKPTGEQSSAPALGEATLSPSGRSPNSMPSPDAFGEPPTWPKSPFANGNPMYSPGIPAANRSQEKFLDEGYKFPEAPPTLIINGKPQQSPSPDPAATRSPGFPMSPDPFGNKGFAAAQDAGPPPPRGSSLPGSRFSQDSASDESGKRERSDSIISKGFRRLWRKSSASGLAAATGRATPGANGVPPLPPMSPIPMSPHPSGANSMAAQQAAFLSQGPQTPLSPSGASVASSDTALASPNPNPKRGSDLDPFHFDQESRYPSHPSPGTRSPPSSLSTRTGSSLRSPSISSMTTATTETLVDEPRKRPSILGLGRSRNNSIANGKRTSGQQQTLQGFLAEDPASLQGNSAPPSRSGFI